MSQLKSLVVGLIFSIILLCESDYYFCEMLIEVFLFVFFIINHASSLKFTYSLLVFRVEVQRLDQIRAYG